MKYFLPILFATILLTSCKRIAETFSPPRPDVVLVSWRINSSEVALKSVGNLFSNDGQRTKKGVNDLTGALLASLVGQGPCTVLITVRNQGTAPGSVDPAAYRLIIQGQTYQPTDYPIDNGFPLTPTILNAGAEKTGVLIFLAPTELSESASKGSVPTDFRYDSRTARVPTPVGNGG